MIFPFATNGNPPNKLASSITSIAEKIETYCLVLTETYPSFIRLCQGEEYNDSAIIRTEVKKRRNKITQLCYILLNLVLVGALIKIFPLNMELKVNVSIKGCKIQVRHGKSTKTELTQKSDQSFQ